MIPEIFRDTTTRKYNNQYTHLFCVLLRMTIGSLIILNKIPNIVIIILTLLTIIMFFNKFLKLPNVWKVYLRTVLVYMFILIFTVLYKEKYNQLTGLLIIVDALMGFQSRHIFDRMGLLIKTN